jgi:hypothetical protein
MEVLLKHAAMAWNPARATRLRLENGSLTVGSVLLPFLAIVIACNLVAGSAQMFFLESLAFGSNQELVVPPLLSNDFSQKLLSAVGPLVSAAAIAILPTRIFDPVGRSATISAVFVIAAAWAFYGAAIISPIYFIAGVLATADIELGVSIYLLFGIPATAIITLLVFWFWFRVFRGVLDLSWMSFALITVFGFGSLLLLFTLVWTGLEQFLP